MGRAPTPDQRLSLCFSKEVLGTHERVAALTVRTNLPILLIKASIN